MLAIFPEIKSCAEEGDIEKLAIMIRMYFGGVNAKKPKIDVDSVIESFGLVIQVNPENEYMGVILVNDVNGKFQVSFLIRDGLGKMERSFLLAHMLGHFLLDVQKNLLKGDLNRYGYGERISPLIRYEQSYYPDIHKNPETSKIARADSFAASLIMPKAMFVKACQTIDDLTIIANIFGTSKPSVQQRKNELLTPRPQAQSNETLNHQPNDKKMKKNLGSGGNKSFDNIDGKQKSQKKSIQNDLDGTSSSKGQSNKGGIKRLRKIAKMFDKSVKI